MNLSEVKKLMLADLAGSGITSPSIIAKHKFTPVMYKLKTGEFAAYEIPYLDISAKPIKNGSRYKVLQDIRTGFDKAAGKRAPKYLQEADTTPQLYLSPLIKWVEVFADTTRAVVITEGEKKTIAGCMHGFNILGLAGVWNFMSKRNGMLMLPIFDKIDFSNRLVYICFDSDAVTNPNIMLAESMLAQRLTERGAIVFICRIPASGAEKVGIDDFLLKHTKEQFETEVLDAAYQYEINKGLHELNQEVVAIKNMDMIYCYDQGTFKTWTIFKNMSHVNRWVEIVIEVPAPRPVGRPRADDSPPKMTTVTVRKRLAPLWLEWPHRATLEGMTYAPGQPRITDSRELNTWLGWGVKDAKKGDIKPWQQLLEHLFDGADPKTRQWFERWCAYPIQHPGYKMASAVVMWGVTQGSGKTLCGHTLMRLYGSNATEVKDSDLEDARFAWAEAKQFVLADDVTGHNSRKLANLFKTMITQKTIHINKKYVPQYSIPDTINYMFTSNDPDAFYLDEGDRRFFIHEVINDKLPEVLRRQYIKWMNSEEGMQALFHHFQNLDLGDFDPQAEALRTEAKREMTSISKSELGAFVEKLKNEPNQPLNGKMRGDLFTAESLYTVYDPMATKHASPNALAREMKRAGIAKLTYPGGQALEIGNRRLRLYAIRNPDKWKHASPKEIADHYLKHNPPMPVAAKGKF